MFDKILQIFVNLLPKPLKKLYDKFEELIVYVYYGVLTTLVNLIVQFASQKLLDPISLSALTFGGKFDEINIKTTLATSIAWLVAVIFAFYVNKKYVFKSVTESRKQLWFELWTFISARIASFFAELVIMNIGAHFYSTDGETITNQLMYWVFKFAAQIVVTLANYFFSKFVIFKKKKSPEESET
ncbi:MAG: GtrA family protein [Oscillospiraceae bacterium]|nr:GtrA family protein [Oscillospiraceae bacterium]